MTWTYRLVTNELTHDGTFEGTGYSGLYGYRTAGYQRVAEKGPIPEGTYEIGSAHTDPKLGPGVMALTPLAGTNTWGRSGFYIHGDNARHDASHGCLILGPTLRHVIAVSEDRRLAVVA